MRLVGVAPSDRERRARDLLMRVGLRERAGHRPDALSGGEQQRVAIAVALANDPPILLADEPTGELDSENGKRVLDLFREVVREDGKTALIATHDSRIAGYVDEVRPMVDGRILPATPRDGAATRASSQPASPKTM